MGLIVAKLFLEDQIFQYGHELSLMDGFEFFLNSFHILYRNMLWSKLSINHTPFLLKIIYYTLNSAFCWHVVFPKNFTIVLIVIVISNCFTSIASTTERRYTFATSFKQKLSIIIFKKKCSKTQQYTNLVDMRYYH